MSAQILLSIVTFGVLAVGTYLMYLRRKYRKAEILREEKLTLDRLLEKVKYQIVDMAKPESINGQNGEEWENAYNRNKRITEALDGCIHGKEKDKIIVKDLIKSICQTLLPTDEAVDDLIEFNNPFIDPMIKFEILMFYLRKEHGAKSISWMFKTYNIDRTRYDIEKHLTPHYAFTAEDVDLVYENTIVFEIPYLDKLEILSTLLYQRYKGFGCIDTLRDMDIDGLNFGTSGSIMSSVLNPAALKAPATRSVWIYFEGKYIHANFFDFHSEFEIRRIVQLVCRWGNPGPLTEKRGFLVNTMFDQSRVLAVRPPASEYWAVFIRKFNLGDMDLLKLVDPLIMTKENTVVKSEDDEPIHKYQNAQLPYNTINYLMEGQVTSAFTGRQGSGKTTIMKYSLEKADGRFTIRILEMTFEMYLREIYPNRNILSLQETQWCTAAALQDALKKSDAAISIVGEVATDIIAARMLQMAQVASIFTIFSHHANTTHDMVIALTNSIVASSGGSATPETVMPQVIDAIHMDVHLDYDVEGNRYIERITEIRRKVHKIEYVPIDKNNVAWCQAENQRRYYEAITANEMFETVDILRFDVDTFTYEAVHPMSAAMTKHIYKRLEKDHREAFLDFVLTNWKDAA